MAMNYIVNIIEILGSLGIFFFGLIVLTEGILHLKGKRMRAAIRLLTKNRVGGVMVGFVITSLIQSSSATTVLVVSFVHVRLMKLKEAIGVIMGANLGTTVTFWAVALLGLEFKISMLVMPAIALSIPFLFSSSPHKRKWGEILIAFGLIFLGLDLLKQAVPDIQSNPEALQFVMQYTSYGYASYLGFILLGILLTVVLQSSSAAGAITLIMAFRGWIDFPIAAAIIMGENIGTTITAYLAALNLSVDAKRAARAHFLFNVIGLGWMLLVFPWFLDLVDVLIPGETTNRISLPFHLAAFHSLFKLANICIVIPFVPQLVRFAEWAVPTPQKEEGQREMMILEKAEEQIQKMISLVQEMYQGYQHALTANPEEVQPDMEVIQKKEYLTDRIQNEMSQGLIRHAFGLVAQQVVLALVDLRILDQLESIADRIVDLMRMLEKKSRKRLNLPKEFEKDLKSASEYTHKLVGAIQDSLKGEMSENFERLIKFDQPLLNHELIKEYEWENESSYRVGMRLLKNLRKINQSCLVIFHALEEEGLAG